MSKEKEQENVVVIEEKKEAVVPEKPTEDDVKDGLSPKEIEMAKGHSLFKEEGKESDKENKGKEQNQEKGEQKGKEEKEKEGEPDNRTAEQKEHDLISGFNKNEQGLYFKQKRETRKRQQAETERDMALTQLKYANKQIEDTKTKKEEKKEKPDDDLNLDDDGMSRKDTLTPEKYKEIREEEKKQDDEKKKANDEANQNMLDIRQRVYEQGEEAKSIYDDFDEVADLASDVIKNHEELFADNPKLEAKAGRIYKNWLAAVSNALDQNQDETAADIAYELGMLHPKYKHGEMKKTEDGNGKDKEDSKKLDRMVENATKKVSSASVTGGGGSRKVSYDDLTLADVASMNRDKYNALPKEVRDRILRE